MDKDRCQSCGMPMEKGFYGTEKNGSESKSYCKFCYNQGAFTDPDMTVDDMVDSSVAFMTENLDFEEEKAREISEGMIPKLKRWQ